MDTINSLRDLGYKQAQSADTLEDAARYAIDNIAGFPEAIMPEAKAEVVGGYRLRYAENKPAKTFIVVDGNYLPEADVKAKKGAEKVIIGVDYAFSFTSQEFGKLKNENPALHAIIGEVRNNASTYCSNRFAELVIKAKKLLAPRAGGKRQELTFTESMTKVFDAQEKSCKVKQAKGDLVADISKYKLAVQAFWSTMN